MISMHEGQIKDILRPETSDKLKLITEGSQKRNVSLLTSQIYHISDLLSHDFGPEHHNFKPSQIQWIY